MSVFESIACAASAVFLVIEFCFIMLKESFLFYLLLERFPATVEFCIFKAFFNKGVYVKVNIFLVFCCDIKLVIEKHGNVIVSVSTIKLFCIMTSLVERRRLAVTIHHQ